MEVCFQGGGGEKVAEGDLIQHFVNPSSKSNRSLTKPSGFVFTIFCGVGSSERRQKVISQPLVLNKVTTTPLWKNATTTKMAICSASLRMTTSSPLTCITTLSTAWARSFHASAATSMAKRWTKKTEVPFQAELKNPGRLVGVQGGASNQSHCFLFFSFGSYGDL